MCVGINGDLAEAGERVASTSNRNFRGRQGVGVRTHAMHTKAPEAYARQLDLDGAIIGLIRIIQRHEFTPEWEDDKVR